MTKFDEVRFDTVELSTVTPRSPVSRRPERWINRAPVPLYDTKDLSTYFEKLDHQRTPTDRIRYQRRHFPDDFTKGCTPDYALANILQAGHGLVAKKLQKLGTETLLTELAHIQSVRASRSAARTFQAAIDLGYIVDAHPVLGLDMLKIAMQMYGPALITIPWWTRFEQLKVRGHDALGVGGNEVGMCSFSVCGYAGSGLIWELQSNWPGWGNVAGRARVSGTVLAQLLGDGEAWAVKRTSRNGGKY